MAVTVVELLEFCIREAKRMESADPYMVVVGAELHRFLVEELGSGDTGEVTVAGCPVVRTDPPGTPATGPQAPSQFGDIPGPDRVSVYVGEHSSDDYPLGHDPAMPVFFVPVPPLRLDDEAQIGIYNHLRWYGLDIEQSFAGARQAQA